MRPAIERFSEKINISTTHFYKNSPCWEWTAHRDRDGYGQFSIKSKPIKAHRFIYEYYYGAICPDLTIDHLCRNRKCVNPFHLEQVTVKVNVLRGIGICALNKQKTHCKRGHEFMKENTRFTRDGKRQCRICTAVCYKNWAMKN